MPIKVTRSSNDYLEHHGILGQKWGVRRYQNEDGTLTEAGRKRYGIDSESGIIKTIKTAKETYDTAKNFYDKFNGSSQKPLTRRQARKERKVITKEFRENQNSIDTLGLDEKSNENFKKSLKLTEESYTKASKVIKNFEEDDIISNIQDVWFLSDFMDETDNGYLNAEYVLRGDMSSKEAAELTYNRMYNLYKNEYGPDGLLENTQEVLTALEYNKKNIIEAFKLSIDADVYYQKGLAEEEQKIVDNLISKYGEDQVEQATRGRRRASKYANQSNS